MWLRRGRRRETVAALPRPGDPLLLHQIAQIAIDMLGHDPQRHFAQRGQVALPEKIFRRRRPRGRRDRLCLRAAARAALRREVDEYDLVGQIEDGIGNGLPHGGTSDLPDGVAPAFEVLDVDRGENVDAGVEQFNDVLVALRMTRTGRVGVRELVDERECGCQGRMASRSISPNFVPRWSIFARGTMGRPASSASVSRGRGSRRRQRPRRGPPFVPAAPPEASRKFCPRPGTCRKRSSACRGPLSLPGV